MQNQRINSKTLETNRQKLQLAVQTSGPKYQQIG